MARADEQFNHRIPKELKEEFDAEAKENGRSATQHLVHVLKRRNDVTSLSVRLEQFIKDQEIFNKAMLDAINKGSKPTGLHEGSHMIVDRSKTWSKKGPNNSIINDSLSKHLPKRVARALSNGFNEIDTVKQLTQLTPQQFKKLVGIGDVSAKIINSFLMDNGFGWIDFK